MKKDELEKIQVEEQIKEFIFSSLEICRRRSDILNQLRKALLSDDMASIKRLASQLVNLDI